MGEGGSDPMEIQPDAAVGANETTVRGPHHFRIGPKKHAYNYTRRAGMFFGGFPVYGCSRGREAKRPPLYL